MSGRISSAVSELVTSNFTASDSHSGAVLFSSNSNQSLYIRRFASDSNPQGPALVEYSSVLLEDEYHRLADSTIQDLLEKLEEYGDSIQVVGFDIDYEVLTLKLGSASTYVLNKQTPNGQRWLASPISGPSRFDWDKDTQAWIYRRSKENLYKLFETELEQLCGSSIDIS